MGNLVQNEAIGLLNASLNTGTVYTAPSTTMKLALIVSPGTASSATTAGTEVTNTGGSTYSRQTISLSAATWGSTTASTSNSNAISFTNMPAGTIHQIEIWDSAGTPVRRWFGTLTADKALGAGDTISFAIGAVSISIG